MRATEETLRGQVLRAWQRHASQPLPTFETTWQAAADRHAQGRRNYRRLAAVAAVAAAIAIALHQPVPGNDPYIEVADLLETTYWVAPSDVLLPDREFDIYRDMPVIFESTVPAGGTLL